MVHAALYSIIRFLPYAETDEFANVGVVMFAPATGRFDFRLSNKWRRLGEFFERLERRVFAEGVRAFNDELLRTKLMIDELVDGGTLGQASTARVFDDLVRPREALFPFSSVRGDALLLAVTELPLDTERHAAVVEVRRDLEKSAR